MPVHTTNERNMRKLFVYILTALIFASCEVIDWNNRLIPVDGPTGGRKHVLLEFTGFRCVNCPTAAEIAQNLEAMYDGRLYAVSLHPASNPFTQGKYDYTCPAADSIYQWMGGTVSTPFPAGNVDCKPFEGEWFSDMSAWATMVYQAMRDNDEIQCEMPLEMSYWLIEDSVLGVQAMPDGTVNDHYYHRHLLRDVKEDAYQLEVIESYNKQQLYILTIYQNPQDKSIYHAYEEKYLDSLGPVDDNK